mmetsp:Transcript_31176/g.101644  ORF Transcript_31176/g.101644 Transcript_31176/m.101644 type:complete len:213 (-) Transcript_31176:1003-1641(-)
MMTMITATITPGLGKGSPKWKYIRKTLADDARVKTVAAKEALKLSRKGVPIVDTRFTRDVGVWRLTSPKCMEIPYLTPHKNPLMRVQGWFIGLTPPGPLKERNDDFVDEMIEAFDGDLSRPFILMCTTGGTLNGPPTMGPFVDAQDSKSLRAAYELTQAGFTRIIHCEGGLNDFVEENYDDIEFEGEWPGAKLWFGYRRWVDNDPRKGPERV